MEGKLSIAEMLSRLEAQITLHRDKQAHHAEQKSYHEAEEARHSAELARLSQHHAAFKAAAAEIEAVLPLDPAPGKTEKTPALDADLGRKPKKSHALSRVVAAWPEGVPFGASEVVASANQRFAGKLSLTPRDAASYLRRRALGGSLEIVREGKPFHETLYRKAGG
ncbi:MAG TPA: hypothetical protein VH988_20570 [Thermoanaerobaculia bacterium]|jgi:hypothetical protein|nr:hypothetical protein [Thermoanaerobaculia bacterium]